MIDEPILSAGHPGPYGFTICGTDTDLEDRLHLFALLSYMCKKRHFLMPRPEGRERLFWTDKAVLDSNPNCRALLDWLHWGDRVIVNT